MSDPSAEIELLHTAWAEAIRNGDVDGAIGLLTADYVLWAPGAEPIEGREAVRALFSVAFGAHWIEPSFESEERLIAEDLAVERGWDVQRIRPRTGGEETTQRQRVFLVLRREADGKWRYARGISQPGPAL